MLHKLGLCRVIGLGLIAPVAVAGEFEISGYLKNETSVFTNEGQTIGQARTTLDNNGHDQGEFYKSEFSFNIDANYKVDDTTKIHAQLRPVYDPEARDGWKGHQLYSQQDWFRELFVDTKAGPLDLRLGKQQLVWGTADGIKLLDIINPTDYREFNQNTMEDSRIPVWMARADLGLGSANSLQFVVAQNQGNVIPGLNASGDRGHPFLMQGVDTITGPVNGFLNISPALGSVAGAFSYLALGGQQQQGLPSMGLAPVTMVTVQDFVNNSPSAQASGMPQACQLYGLPAVGSATCLDTITQAVPTLITIPGLGTIPRPGGNNQNVTNLIDGANWNLVAPNSAFEYMPLATFATFNSFVGWGSDPNNPIVGINSRYKRDYPDAAEPNFGLRFKSSIRDSFNYTLNYLYNYDPNPSVNIHWEGVGGQRLVVDRLADPFGSGNTTVLLRDPRTPSGAGGTYYGAYNPFTFAPTNLPPATLAFVETLNRIHNIGASFDTSVDTPGMQPIVLRGEFLYQKDVSSPIINRNALEIGDVVNGLYTRKGDMFKYVLGVDITVLTNLLISTQFIQFVNLDFVDKPGEYTGDMPTLHLSNGLNKGDKYKNFGSLFFSKPFGEAQLGRLNNITIMEKGGGYWNRLDAEYSFTNNLIGLAEWNNYWGDKDTMFGQFNKSSNFQLGVKYLF